MGKRFLHKGRHPEKEEYCRQPQREWGQLRLCFERQLELPLWDKIIKRRPLGKIILDPEAMCRVYPPIQTKKWGIVTPPELISVLDFAEVSKGNAPFYTGPSSTKGMNPKTWPSLLRESLEGEEDFMRRIMKRAEGKGVFVELGCGTGRYLPDACANFEGVIGMDVSPAMMKIASEFVALECGPKGAEKTRLYLMDMVGGWEFLFTKNPMAGMVLGGFNTFPGNLTDEQRIKTLCRARAHLMRSEGEQIYPLAFSAYVDKPRTRRMQEEFYENMGLRVVTTREHAEMGFSVAQAPDGSFLKSQRNTPEKIRALLGRISFRVREIAQISEAMMAVVATVEKKGSAELGEPATGKIGKAIIPFNQLRFSF